MKSFQNAVFISGATGYAGRKIALHLAAQGENLVVSGRDSGKLANFIKELALAHPELEIAGVVCDLSKPGSWSQTTEDLMNYQFKGYINCSGIQGTLGKSLVINQETFQMVFNVNLHSSIYFTNFFFSNKVKSLPMSIIHFSGGGSTAGRPNFMAYSLSKTALVRFVENFSIENPDQAFKVNAIAPGVMPSHMQEEILEDINLEGTVDFKIAEEAMKSQYFENQRLLLLCDFLMSEKSDGISGKLISATWDNWEDWPKHLESLKSSDLYTLRRIIGRDRGVSWGDL